MVGAAQYIELQQLYAQYSSAVDAGDWDQWIDLFTDECTYKLQPRENYDRGYPLATLCFESKDMLRDRVYAVRETLFHDPYYQRHIVGPIHVHRASGTEILSEAAYAVFRTKTAELSAVFNVGRYIDHVAVTQNGLKFVERQCIYDSELIPNSIIYPL